MGFILLKNKSINKFDRALAFTAPFIYGYTAYNIAEYPITQRQRRKEYEADLFSRKALLKENNIRALAENFLFWIEDYEKDKFGNWIDFLSTHPSSFKRAQATLTFLQENGFDLLALPISAQDAKKFNAYLKQYFPSIYAQCIKNCNQKFLLAK